MLLASILSLAAVSIAAPWLSRALGKANGLLALAPLAWFLAFLSQLESVAGGLPLAESTPWIAELGVALSFRLDGLSLLFALLITGIGSLVTLYAAHYLGAAHHDDHSHGHAHGHGEGHAPAHGHAPSAGHPLRHRFFAYLIGFLTSMLGLVLADNLVLLFIFWELTSITSYLLIGFDHQEEKSRKSALQALLVTGLGGLAMLAGVFMLGQAAGDIAGVAGGIWDINAVIAAVTAPGAAPQLLAHPLLPGIIACIVAGAATKSAQFPFHFWLPNAMAAPTPVSAYLHSSTMVKAGVYLLLRLNPAMAASPAWQWTLAIMGGVTMVVGAVLATRESQFKKVLAYSTVSSLGIMVMCTGLGGDYGAEAAVVYLLAHALFKACLFLVAGIVTHETGSKEIEPLGDLFYARGGGMKITGAAAGIAALSMAGVPFLLGFAGKEAVLHAAWHPGHALHGAAWAFTLAVVAAAAFTVLAALLVGVRPFFQKPDPRGEHEAPAPKGREPAWPMWLGPAALATLCIVGAVAPFLGFKSLAGAASASVTAVPSALSEPHADDAPHAGHPAPPASTEWTGYALTPVSYDDAPQHTSNDDAHGAAPAHAAPAPAHGAPAAPHAAAPHTPKLGFYELLPPFAPVSGPLTLSMLVLLGGVALYTVRRPWRTGAAAVLNAITPIGPEAWYHRLFQGTLWFASWQTRVLQNGKLRYYIGTVLGTAMLLVGAALLRNLGLDPTAWNLGLGDFAVLDIMLMLIIVVTAFACTRFHGRLTTVAALGVVGYCVAMLFVILGVPDIAMTQFAIETLTVVLFVLVVYHLPRFNSYTPWWRRLMDGGVALAFGAVMTTLVLVSLSEQVSTPSIAGQLSDWSYAKAHGRNVVNVILVDFRGFDTMGEITVLGIAAIGVYTLLRLRGTGFGSGIDGGSSPLQPAPAAAGGHTDAPSLPRLTKEADA